VNEPSWILLPLQPTQTAPVVWRKWPDGKQESQLVSSFAENDSDYADIMQLVAEGKLTIAPVEGG
jgi:hypothetical protein